VIAGHPLARGQAHAVTGAPVQDLLGRALIRQPHVVRHREVLAEHRAQRRLGHRPRLGGRPGDDERHVERRRDAQVAVHGAQSVDGDDEASGEAREVAEGDGIEGGAAGGGLVDRLEPPLPEADEASPPQQRQRRDDDPVRRPQGGDEGAPAELLPPRPGRQDGALTGDLRDPASGKPLDRQRYGVRSRVPGAAVPLGLLRGRCQRVQPGELVRCPALTAGPILAAAPGVHDVIRHEVGHGSPRSPRRQLTCQPIREPP